MDTQRFELLLRETPFCGALLAEVWDRLSTMERIDLLLHAAEPQVSLSKELKVKALTDQNPVIRMLAVRCSYLSEHDDPDLYATLKADESPFVRAVMQKPSGYVPRFEEEDLLALSQVERLGVIALDRTFSPDCSSSGRYFAKLITDALANQTMSEGEAGELVIEFVRNPQVIQKLFEEGDRYRREDFEAMWNLTTCTPESVHDGISARFPLTIGPRGRDTIPDEMLDRMSKETLALLAFRQHKPLLKLLEETTDRFDKMIYNMASYGAEAELSRAKKQERQARADVVRTKIDELHTKMDELRIDGIRQEFDELRKEFSMFQSEWRQEIRELRSEGHRQFADLTQQISQATSRRQGFFG